MAQLTISLAERPIDSVDLRRLLEEEIDEARIQAHDEDVDGLVTMGFLIVAVALAITVGTVTRVLDWIRQRSACLLVIDARHADLIIEERCDLASQRGKIVLVCADDVQLRLADPKGVLDLEGVIAHAINGASTLAERVAKQAGVTPEIESPGTGL